MLSVRGEFDGIQVKLLEPVPFTEVMDVIVTFLPKGQSMTTKPGNWRELKGSSQGAKLTEALLKSRREDLARET